ncbi:response regulator [Dyella acidiphila]|uniref:Response regulator transcription factor n=1 Tax=Dyella acidiphila TaxID=2775866 RepID=A0ABR9G8Z3_9GAMM|nr:response regulator transcription factor [Dyella acidiphila]MBE1160522.1 response regulator transcription factor [Dyella acidiphila]
MPDLDCLDIPGDLGRRDDNGAPWRYAGYKANSMGNRICERTRVTLLDDHPLVLHALAALLEETQRVSVVQSFSSSRDLLEALPTLQTDVLVMDYSLAPGDLYGVSLLRTLRQRFPALEILVISGHGSALTATLSMRSGARGFVYKTQPVDDWIEAIFAVAAHQRYVGTVPARELEQTAGALVRDRSISQCAAFMP